MTIDDATGANNCNVSAVIQHCDDTNTDNFTNIAGFGAPFLVAAGNDSNVIGASRLATLPPGTKRYVRAQATGESDGGNSADGNLTLDLVF